MQLLGIALAAFGLAAVFTHVLLEWAIDRELLDHPNERSSHALPTPTGGGGAMIAALLLILVGTHLSGLAQLDWIAVAALGAVALMGIVGWIDDHRELSVGFRLLAQVCGGVLLLPAVVPLSSGGETMSVPVLAAVAVWWILWATSIANVVNFMDGLDGLVAAQVAIFGIHVAAMDGWVGFPSVLGTALSGVALGFLIWNWAPAKIFMGNVGALGLAYGVLGSGALLAASHSIGGFVAVYLPLMPIGLDAGFTLLRRWLAGEQVTQAHRSHLYQRLAASGWGHARVTLLYAMMAFFGMLAAAATDLSSALLVGIVYLLGLVLLGAALELRLRLAPSAL